MIITKKKWQKILALLLVVLMCIPAVPVRTEAATTTIHVLMIGNSFTKSRDGKNYTVKHMKRLAAKQGITLDVQTIAYGASTLERYSKVKNLRNTVQKALKKKKWDYVILQEHQDKAVYSYKTYYNGAKKLYAYIKEYAPQAKVLLNTVWPEARKMKAGGKCYSRRQQKNNIANNTEKVARNLGIPYSQIIYSGKCFWRYEHLDDEGKRVNLYRDREHGSDAGYYLNALCIIQRICPKNVSALHWYSSAGKKEARKMMKIVEAYHPK